ncbi:MAG TPA: septal ring lytic transglycosylase RlpA family protein [Steroidobacteraceae bacterium]|nr:septal ring lytic transglycosylase RlpA family protein [Steroidobacteraceae bacterium]
MNTLMRSSNLVVLIAAGSTALFSPGAVRAQQPVAAHHLDRSGHERVGKASFYAARLGGKTMADGTPMRLRGNNAASKTLPLGTTAMVTNLETGKRAIVTIRDRGPYVKGRIVDLSPATAQKIGITPKQGIAKVQVKPLEVPLADGTLKPGESGTEKKAAQQDARTARLNRTERLNE